MFEPNVAFTVTMAYLRGELACQETLLDVVNWNESFDEDCSSVSSVQSTQPELDPIEPQQLQGMCVYTYLCTTITTILVYNYTVAL